MSRLAVCFLTFSLLMFAATMFAATKVRNWKTGKIIDPVTNSSEDTRGATGRPNHNEDDPHIVTIQGGDSIYTAQERHAWNSWCLLIVGDEIKYAQDKHSLYLVDASGAKCKFDLVREEKRQ